MIAIVSIILLHLAYVGWGAAALDRLFTETDKTDPLRIPLAYFTGVFINIIALHIAVMIGLTSGSVAIGLMLVGLVAFVVSLRDPIASHYRRFRTLRFQARHLVYLLVVAIALIAYALIALRMLGTPEVAYDTTAFWLLKAQLFYYGGDLWSDAFQNLNRIHAHKDYPLYIPLFWFQNFVVIGFPDDHLLKLGVFIYNGFGALLFFFLTRYWAGTFAALLLLAILLFSPVHGYSTHENFLSINGSISSLYAEFPLSIAILGSLGFYLKYLRSKSSIDLFGAVMFIASSILIKREGTLWFLLFSMMFVISVQISSSDKRKEAYTLYSLPLIVFGGWWILKSMLPDQPSEFHLPRSIDGLFNALRLLPAMISAWFERLVNINLWGVLGILTVIGFCTGIFRNRRHYRKLIPCLAPIGYLVCSFLVIMLFASQVVDTASIWHHLTGGSNCLLNRLMLHIHLAALFLAVVLNSDKFIRLQSLKEQ